MTLRTAAALAGALVLVAAAIGIYVSWPKAEPVASALPFARASKPKQLPAFDFQDAAGRQHSLADFRGRLVLLNIWATWCAPCREEMPALDRLQAKLGGPGFAVVALSIDQQGAQVARKFFDEVGIKALELYIDPSAQAAFKLSALGLPATLLVDRDGREVGRHLGPVKWDAPEIIEELRRKIDH